METKKLQQEELQQLISLQQKNQDIIMEFGQIEVLKLEIEDRVQIAKQYLAQIREQEKALVQSLQSAYGEGTIDLDKGEFIPSK